MPLSRTPRTAAVLLAVALGLAACGDGDDPGAAATPRPAGSGASATAPAPGPTGALTDPSTDPGSSALSPASAAPSAPASSGAATGSSGSPAPGRTAAARPAVQGTAPGRYDFDASGTVTFGTTPQQVEGAAELAVTPVSGGTQKSVLTTEQGSTQQDLVLRADGAYLSRLQITNAAFDKTFAPSPAALLVPEPPTVGRTWSWKATSTDGKTTAAQSSQVVRQESVTVGGKAVPAYVISTTLTLRGDITYDGTITTWYSRELRLQVKDRQQGKGMVSGFRFGTDITSVLRSTTPR